MSTAINNALSAKVLEEYVMPGWEGRQPVRPLYAAGKLFDWFDNEPRLFDRRLGIGGRDRSEHLLQFLNDMRCDDPLRASDLKRVEPTRSRVWKLHPQGLRIYGWFCEPGVFVAIEGALVEDTKNGSGLNNVKRKAVETFASKHGLENTMLKGDHRAIIHGQN